MSKCFLCFFARVSWTDESCVISVLKHVTAAVFLMNNQEKMLINRLSRIIDNMLFLARNAHDFIQRYIVKTKELHGKVLILHRTISVSYLRHLIKEWINLFLQVLKLVARKQDRKSKKAKTKKMQNGHSSKVPKYSLLSKMKQ